MGTDVYVLKHYMKSLEILAHAMEDEHDKESLTLMVESMKEHIYSSIKMHEKINDILR